MVPEGQSESWMSSKLPQANNKCIAYAENTTKPASSSYASFLRGKFSADRARTQNAVTSADHDAVPPSINEHTQSLSKTLTTDPIQQQIPAAPQRLRIRRQSMRQETVELLAVLDDLIQPPAYHSRKAYADSIISNAALRIENDDNFSFFSRCVL